ncbi:MAG: histone deacetylase family protein [Dokdonella sp.]|uniref:histone deacetylase family protein n=1 Tax=Dokdonella sp. TaxID=2291710 RepID=UPI0025C4772E|nr:histone deacetylase family protein [Dokdonella sp.]MBX3699878.1 histone deacetylase family protein [Dokdonella sp.]
MTAAGGIAAAPRATVALYTHVACLDHDPGPGHPERVARLEAVLGALSADAFPTLLRREAPRASRAQLARVHARHLIDSIIDHGPLHYWRMLDADTMMSPGSAEAAQRAAGAVCAAVDAVLGGDVQRAFCAVRPPGHHATTANAMGFCLFNNIAVGAAHALAAHGLERVAVVDFDVHHGNGTQDIFWSEARVLYASTHQSPLYPGTGASDETGLGNIINAPLPPDAGSSQFRTAFDTIVLPALEAFAPQLVLVSAGFDAHRLDPLANLNLEAADYAWVTRRLVALAMRHAGGRLVSSLEGGYDLDALRESSAAHVAALLD